MFIPFTVPEKCEKWQSTVVPEDGIARIQDWWCGLFRLGKLLHVRYYEKTFSQVCSRCIVQGGILLGMYGVSGQVMQVKHCYHRVTRL